MGNMGRHVLAAFHTSHASPTFQASHSFDQAVHPMVIRLIAKCHYTEISISIENILVGVQPSGWSVEHKKAQAKAWTPTRGDSGLLLESGL